MRVLALSLCLALIATGGELRADPPVPLLKDVVLGEHWFGREVTLAELEGKVVLFVLWGT